MKSCLASLSNIFDFTFLFQTANYKKIKMKNRKKENIYEMLIKIACHIQKIET